MTTRDWSRAFCDPGDAELLELMYRAKRVMQSGWNNWSLADLEEAGTVVRTDTQGRRVVPRPYDEVVAMLEAFKRELKRQGIHPNEARGAAKVEEWLDRTFPKICPPRGA